MRPHLRRRTFRADYRESVSDLITFLLRKEALSAAAPARGVVESSGEKWHSMGLHLAHSGILHARSAPCSNLLYGFPSKLNCGMARPTGLEMASIHKHYTKGLG